MTWKHTYSGVAIDLLDPRPEDIRIEDIAHALAYLCRFTGHCLTHYSVAQHSILVAGQCEIPPGVDRRKFRLAALLHDAHEAYLGDIATPIKQALGPAATAELRAAEERFDVAIADAFGFGPAFFHRAEIKTADKRALETERIALMSPPPRDWGLGVEPFPGTILPWTAAESERAFLEVFGWYHDRRD